MSTLPMSPVSEAPPPRPIPLPVRRKPVIANSVMGMLLFIVAEGMFFAGLISAFTISRANAGAMWPPPGQPMLPAHQTAFNTVALLLAGALGVWAFLRFRKERPAMVPLLLSFVLGALFVALQGREWVMLIAQGLTMRSSQMGSFFYLIVGAHGAHALLALGLLGIAAFRLSRNTLSKEFLLSAMAFWWFVVAAWPAIYFRVYF